MPPLVLTLHLDVASQARFEAERQRYFPQQRNHIPAHLTLFHQLPDEEFVPRVLAEAARKQNVFPVAVTGLRSLGRGVAYALASPVLQEIHGQLAAVFAEDLIAQDRQRFQPHVVVQNKTSAEDARRTLAELSRVFEPFSVCALGLDLWIYRDGPWEFRETFWFA